MARELWGAGEGGSAGGFVNRLVRWPDGGGGRLSLHTMAGLNTATAIPDRVVADNILYTHDASWDAMHDPRTRLRLFQVRRRVGRTARFRTTRAQSRWLGWGARQAVESLRQQGVGMEAVCPPPPMPVTRASEAAGVRRRRGDIAGCGCSALAEPEVLEKGEWERGMRGFRPRPSRLRAYALRTSG